MKVPFGTISVTQESKDLIKKILDSARISSGKYVKKFETKFAQLLGAKEAVALSSGTDADILALAVLYDFGANRGDEVIIPALSFVATGNAVLHAGFKPVFVDVQRDTLNIDPDKIEEVITAKTRAIMPVHLMGKPAEMDKIKKVAKQHGIYVIEDAAEAHGAKYKGKEVGIIGDMGAFSLYIAHIVTTGEGGIVVTANLEFAEILRSLRSHGRACKCKECVINTSDQACSLRFKHGTDIRFFFERVGYSSKMNEMEAAIGLGNLKLYDQILEKRRFNFFYLHEKFQKFSPYFKTIKIENYEEIGPHAFPIILEEGVTFTRNEFVKYLESNGVDSRSLFLSMPTQAPGFSFLGYRLGQFPNAEYIGNNGLHIGVHQDLEKEHLDYFLGLTDSFLKERCDKRG
ncbi:MAG: DegT/DnrJ/EryC1/StrS family aminotransferase [Candidatus Omnitrophota bacterium]|nr:DegT/DnrJ/EryC1/StrS family aminotransferase [Candidatus Omnitrophota bacterium]